MALPPKKNGLKKTFNSLEEAIKDFKENVLNKNKTDTSSSASRYTNDNLFNPFIELLEKDLETIKEILKKNPALLSNSYTNHGNLLSTIVKKKRLDVLKIAIDLGIDVNLKCPKEDRTRYRPDDNGFDSHPESKKYGTALFYAADNNSLDIVKLLLANKADPNIANATKATPLHIAARHGRLEIARELVKAGANLDAIDNLGNTALFYAITNKQTKMAEYLISAGADINIKNRYNNSVLHAAVEEGEKNLVKLLLSKNIAVNTRNNAGKTALYIAIPNIKMTEPSHFQTYHEMVDMLLKAGAKPDIQTKETGDSAIIKAAEYGHYPIVEMLISKNADIDITKDNACNALIMTVRMCPISGRGNYNYHRIVEALIKSGANINEQDSYGKTALYHACDKNNLDLVKTLLANGADTNINAFDKTSPLTVAIGNHNHDLVVLLLKNKANHKHQIKIGETLIEFAQNQVAGDKIIKTLREWTIEQRKKCPKTQKIRQDKKQTEISKRQQNLRKFIRRPKS